MCIEPDNFNKYYYLEKINKYINFHNSYYKYPTLFNKYILKLSNPYKEIDYSVIKERIQKTVQEKITEIGSKGVIFGLSGGIDSAVIAYLSKDVETSNALICQATAIIMPDSKISPERGSLT